MALCTLAKSQKKLIENERKDETTTKSERIYDSLKRNRFKLRYMYNETELFLPVGVYLCMLHGLFAVHAVMVQRRYFQISLYLKLPTQCTSIALLTLACFHVRKSRCSENIIEQIYMYQGDFGA